MRGIVNPWEVLDRIDMLSGEICGHRAAISKLSAERTLAFRELVNAGWSQRTIAEELGITEARVSQVLSRTSERKRTCPRIT